MQYFIPWVILLLAAILSVPIVNWLEKRKLRSGHLDQPVEEELGEAEEDAAQEPGEEADAGLEPTGEGEEIAEDEFAALE